MSRVALHHTLVHGTFAERRGAREETGALCLLSTIYGQESQVMQGSMEPTVSDLVMLLKTLDCDRRDALTAIWYALLSLGALAERNALHRRSRQRDRRTKCFYFGQQGGARATPVLLLSW